MMMKKIYSFMFIALIASMASYADPIMNDTSVVGGCNVLNLGAYSGTVQLIPQFQLSTFVCDPGYYLPADAVECVECPTDHYCVGGGYQYNTTTDQGIMECPNSWYSPAGMHELSSCGRILHIGDEVVYLRSTKKTTPSLNVDIDNDGEPDFFGNVTPLDVPMTRGTERKLKVSYDNTTYSVYDDSVDLSQYQD